MKNHYFNVLLVIVGYILSPLSWWNDLIFNIPLAYLISVPFSLVNKNLFLPAFIAGYWLTNLAGFILIYWGGEGLLKQHYQKLNYKQSLLMSIFCRYYTYGDAWLDFSTHKLS